MKDMDLSELTNKIINQRKHSREGFANKEKKLFEIEKKVKDILKYENEENEGIWKKIIIESSANEEWKETFDKARTIKNRLGEVLSETRTSPFYLAYDRACREYVNVGSVGATQDGKSEFNAKIATLDKEILPRGKGGESCTTASINIINGPSPDGKEDIVRVYFYTVKEFSELLYSYFIELGGKVVEFERLKSIDTKDKLKAWVEENKNIKAIKLGEANQAAAKNWLAGFTEHVGEYIERLGKKPKDYTFSELRDKENKEKSKEYYSSVSYYENPDDQDAEDKKYYCFATKKAEVYTNFKIGNEEPIQNLQFLDTPGIGESRLGLGRIWAQSIRSDLDIIIAIKAAKYFDQTDGKRAELTAKLRELLNKRPHASKTLFFILNLWDDNNDKEKAGSAEKKKLKESLETALGNYDTIDLDDSHFRTIDIKNMKEYDDKGNPINNNDPVHKYLCEIFKKLIPEIGNIDKELFLDAEKEFSEIEKEYNSLKELIKSLSSKLPNNDFEKQRDVILETIEDELEKAYNKMSVDNIASSIKDKLEEFSEQPTGTILCKLLDKNMEEDLKNFDFDEADRDKEQPVLDFISKFCKDNEKLTKAVSRLAWDDGTDLTCYVNLKSKLLDKIKEEILSSINVEEAQNKIGEVKKTIAKIFINTGKLGFVSDDEELWWSKMANLLKEENYSPELTKIFSDFAGFSIDYEAKLKDSLVTITMESRHADNFGSPICYFFNEYENAKKAIVHSLLSIEGRMQGLVDVRLCRNLLTELVNSFTAQIKPLTEMNSLKMGKKTPLRIHWEDFYKKHTSEIFKDGDTKKKAELIDSWNELCMQNI